MLQEEVEELWAEIKKRPEEREIGHLVMEAVQVGAMVQRLYEDHLARKWQDHIYGL